MGSPEFPGDSGSGPGIGDEGLFRSIVEEASDAILVADDQGRYVLANRAASELLGVPAGMLIGRRVADFTSPSPNPGAAWAPFLARGCMSGEYQVTRADGSVRDVEFGAVAHIRHGLHLSILRDITRQKEAERALVASERKFSAIFASSPHGIFLGEVESCRIIETNPAFQELIGRSRQDTIGRIPPDLGFDVSRGLRQAVIGRLRAGEVVRNLEVNVTRRPGDVRRVMMAFDSLVLEGAPRLFLAVAADVTERHHLEEQLRQAQKMEAIGRLAGGIAHDFNNLLTAIIGYAELVHHAPALSSELRGDVEEILKAGRSAAGLTGQLLAFSRRQVMQPRRLSLNDTVRHIESILRRVLGEDVLLATRLASPLGPVFSDPVQIEQVLMNLAVNARDAMPGGGHMTIETANVQLDDEHAATHRGASAGPHVLLAVGDTGSGMDETVKSRLFEPFFTTKERGTGLGLATVYGVIRQMGGAILVESAPGQGTTFRIYLPAADGTAAEEVRTAAPASLAGTETILLVEDQEEVRRVAAQILTRHGYGVIQASGAREALRLAADAGTRFHLLLTDVVMPELSGPALARQVKALRPELRVLYTSGYTDDAIGHHGVLEPDIAFAPKPFTPHALLQKVREVLDAPTAPRI